MNTFSTLRRAFFGVAAAGLVVGAVACDGLLEVQDLDRFTSEDVDQALEAVAAGVEGDLHLLMDTYVIYQGLLSDELQHTGTWSNYDDADHGRFIYANNGMEGTYGGFLQARWFALDAEARFNRVLGEAEAATSPLMAQVKTISAVADLFLGQAWCEGPLEPSSAAVSDDALLQQAVTKFTEAIAVANAANAPEFRDVATAGRARANLLLGNYDAAMSDAGSIPDGWEKLALFSQNSTDQQNGVVSLITEGNNRAAGIREKWWAQVDNDASALLDPWTNEADPRVAIHFDGSLGVDGVTDHYSQVKYSSLDSDIPLFDSEEMRLIEAEVLWRSGDLDGAQAKMNALRAAVGLSALPATTDSDVVKDYILSERFAEFFMEGMRATDLARFGLVADVFGALNDPERPPLRPTKFPMDEDEARDNPNIDNSASARCLPMSS